LSTDKEFSRIRNGFVASIKSFLSFKTRPDPMVSLGQRHFVEVLVLSHIYV
jgi:hypothetical protein